MKKAYETPKICYESFSLANSISAGCAAFANLAEYQCSVTIPGLGNIFTDDLTCEYTDPGTDDKICYHAPTEWNNVYSS